LLTGGSIDQEIIKELSKNRIVFRQIYSGRLHSLYELDTITSLKAIPTFKDKIVMNVDSIISEQQYMIASNGESYGSVKERSNKYSVSGNYSFKLDKQIIFGANYRLLKVKPGDKYLLKVWRLSDNSDGILVVSANLSNNFYQAQNNYTTINNQKWKLIQMSVVIPDNFSETELKVYLWNSGSSEIYFDDLSIERE
jgi:hypothetical protein